MDFIEISGPGSCFCQIVPPGLPCHIAMKKTEGSAGLKQPY